MASWLSLKSSEKLFQVRSTGLRSKTCGSEEALLASGEQGGYLGHTCTGWNPVLLDGKENKFLSVRRRGNAMMEPVLQLGTQQWEYHSQETHGDSTFLRLSQDAEAVCSAMLSPEIISVESGKLEYWWVIRRTSRQKQWAGVTQRKEINVKWGNTKRRTSARSRCYRRMLRLNSPAIFNHYTKCLPRGLLWRNRCAHY